MPRAIGELGQCYPCAPQTNDQFLNACPNSGCVPFDESDASDKAPACGTTASDSAGFRLMGERNEKDGECGAGVGGGDGCRLDVAARGGG